MSQPERSYKAAIDQLNRLIPNRAVTSLFEKGTTKDEDPNLRALPEMIDWLSRAGYTPSDLAALKCVHVAGTKGKGSTCAYITSILTSQAHTAGKVGTYTSPHLVSPRERIAIDGVPLTKAAFARYFFEVWDRFTEAARHRGEKDPEGAETKPFYFRFMTIMAFHVFLKEGVRSAVVEVGIGGAYDATNVLPAEAVTVAVVTQLGMDHVAMLGDTHEKIAWHKAGVMKQGRPAVVRLAEEREAVVEVLRQRSRELGASELIEVSDKEAASWGGADGALKGAFQGQNQALAVLAAEQHLAVLEGRQPVRKLADVSKTLVEPMKGASLRGRHETIEDARGVRWLLDGAHTTESLAETARWLASIIGTSPHKKVVLLFNQQERDASKLLTGFLDDLHKAVGRDSVFEGAIFSRNDLVVKHGVPEAELQVQKACCDTFTASFPGVQAAMTPDLTDAIRRVMAIEASLSGMGHETTVLVTGSMHLVGNLISLLEPEDDD